MAKSKKEQVMPIDLVNKADLSMSEALLSNPKYALTADPTGALRLSEKEKLFINNYSEVKNIAYAAHLAGIPEDEALVIFRKPTCKQEIRRINLARYQRKFTHRLLSIDEIGGYLTSVLTDDDVAEADKLSGRDKLSVAKMIIDLNKMKADAYNNPNQIIAYEGLEEDLQDLDADSIKKLIEETKAGTKAAQINEQKSQIIKEIINGQTFEPSDITALESMSIDELIKMNKEIKDGK